MKKTPRALLAAALLSSFMQCAARAQKASPAADAWKQTLGPAALEARQTHGSVDVLTLGEGMHRIYVFLPAEPSVDGKTPFVFFHHGWQGMDPKNYGALIDHLARAGDVVLFPVYQDSDTTSPQIVVANVAAAERDALVELEKRGITPDTERVVYFGYSMGAAISLKLAVSAGAEHLPWPQALVLAAPGDAYHVARGANAKSIWPAVGELRSTLPIAIVTGATDKAIGLPAGRKLALALCASAVRPDRRVLLVLSGDEHAGKKVSAGHGSPGAPDSRYDFPLEMPVHRVPLHIAGRNGFEESASLNQLDFFGYWKVLDAVIGSLTAAPSTSRSYVPPPIVFRKGTPGQTYMGTWPDGTPFRPAHVEGPCTP